MVYTAFWFLIGCCILVTLYGCFVIFRGEENYTPIYKTFTGALRSILIVLFAAGFWYFTLTHCPFMTKVIL